MLDLYLIRHGQTAPNAERRYPMSGEDAHLSEVGERQAGSLKLPAGTAYSSPAARCLQTAALAGYRSVRALLELREAEFGIMAGHTWAELEAAHGPGPVRWITALSDPTSPEGPLGGESGAAFHARVQGWLNTLPASGTILAFTHLGPVLAALWLCVGLRAAEVSPGGVTHLRRSSAEKTAGWWLVELRPGPVV